MKIAFYTDTYFPQVNGVTFTLQAWRSELESKGHEVHILYPGGDYTPKEREHPFASTTLWFYPEYRMAMPFKIPSIAKEFDIVHEHGLYGMAVAGLRASKKYKSKRMLTFHTPGDEYLSYLPLSRLFNGLYKGIYMSLERWLLNSFGKVTTASPVIEERLKANGVLDVEVLSNGIDLKLFHETDTEKFKQENNIKDGKVLGFAGRLGYEKHVEDLIKAAEGFDGTVLIAGGGPAEKHYRKLAKNLNNVRFLGYMDRSRLKEFYSCLDVFVFPSFCETQGLVALEAMACGVPVVAVPVLALKATVEEGVTGYHYRPADIADLHEKIDMCYENMDTLRKGCLKEAEVNSVERTVERLLDIYKTL
jgi:glycosyltransferase involved in cell wall biosynthesis